MKGTGFVVLLQALRMRARSPICASASPADLGEAGGRETVILAVNVAAQGRSGQVWRGRARKSVFGMVLGGTFIAFAALAFGRLRRSIHGPQR